jgi:uncharacterized coiled-coil protein SlyX
MTVGSPEYADDMPATDARIDSICQDLRASDKTIWDIVLTVKGHTSRLDRVDRRLDRMDRRLDKMEDRLDGLSEQVTDVKGTVEEILTLVRPKA